MLNIPFTSALCRNDPLRRRSARRAASAGVAALLLGCGAVGDGADRPGAAAARQAATVPSETWTFVPIAGMACANDTATGIGVNLTSRSSKLYIYLEGGGGCWDARTCGDAFHIQDANLGGFGAANLQRVLVTGAPEYTPPIPAGYGATGIFDRTSAANPFRDYSYAYVPYCTADMYTGDRPRSPATGLSHVGHANMAKALAWLAAAFPPAPGRQVVLSGGSAGAYGALWNFPQAQAAFGQTTCVLVTESGPPLPDPFLAASLEDAWRVAWGLDGTRPAGAPSTRMGPVFRWLAAAYPTRRMGLVAMTGDATLAAFLGLPLTGTGSLSEGLAQLRRDLAPSANASFFYVWSVEHTFIHKAPTAWPAHWAPPFDDGETLSRFVSRQLQ